MSAFAFSVNKDSKQIITDIANRLKSNNVIKNPFTGQIKLISAEPFSDIYMMQIQPLYPNYTLMAWLGAFAVYVFAGFNFVFWIFVGIGTLGVFWMKHFYMIMLWISLRKAGYKGRLKFFNNDETIEWLLSE